MADIVIRGMEMPEENEILVFDTWNGKMYARSTANTGKKQYEVVPLPEGHGRLVDADALIAEYTDEINKLIGFAEDHEKAGRLDAYRACHLRAAYLSEARIRIKATPTIIEAEGGTDNG